MDTQVLHVYIDGPSLSVEMKKRRLEMLLEQVESFSKPVPEMEQYTTPPAVASELLYPAYLRGDLEKVCDLGCGTGILAIGAALLGARAVGVELDRIALQVAKANASRIGVHVDFVRGDLRWIALRRVPTVVMNPPFGAQKASQGDRIFLKKGLEIADVIYSIHRAGSEGFIRRFVKPCTVEEIRRIRFPIRRCFEFHSIDVKMIEVDLYRIVCRGI